MSMMIDGGVNIYNFRLSDRDDNNNYYYQILSKGSLQDAIKIAQKHFIEKCGHNAYNFQNNVTGFPLITMG